MKRREFLKITGLLGTGSLLLESCKHQGKSTLPLLVQDEVPIPGAEEWVSSVCCQCPAGCGISVRVMEGKAKKIEGNPIHPLNQGKLCARGQAGLQVLYNPDRIQGPLKRAGARGAGQWSKMSWDEAIKLAAGKLKEFRQKEEAHTFGFLTGKYHGHMSSLVERFMMAFGSPNHVSYELFSDEPLLKANLINTGYETFVAHDLENVNYLLSFGAEYLETSRSPVRYNLAYGHMRQGRPGVRAKVVQVQSRFSLTAANADEWVPIQPGSEGALAAAIAHTILDEGLYNHEFVKNATSGFETFKNLILKEYPPKEVSALTGISEDKVKQLARDFAKLRPSMALCGDSALAHTNGLTTALAVNALNAIMGNFGQAGGIFFDALPPFGKLPEVRKDRPAREGLRMPRLDRADHPNSFATDSITKLAESLITGQPYTLKVLFLHEVNPVFSLPRSLQFRQALEKIPFIVSFSSFMDESAQMADLVLPDQTFLERWQDHVPSPGLGIPIAGIIKPVVKPLHDVRNTPDVLISIAKELGGDVAASFPWETFVDFLKQGYNGLQREKRGSVVAGDANEFWDKVAKQGGWWDLKHKRECQFQTKSKRFEFTDIPREVSARPTFDGDEKDYPFHLNIYQSMGLSDGRGANQPWLQEMPDPMTSVSWGSWIEINPKTAQMIGVQEGDWVWVESAHGKIKIPALIFPGAMPNVVNIPVGQGHETFGRYAQGRGANPLQILTALTEPVSGSLAWAATRVKVYKADGNARLAKVGFDRQHTNAEKL